MKPSPTKALGVSLLVVGVAMVTFGANPPSESNQPSRKVQEGTTRSSTPERIEARGVENLFRLSPRLYSGSQPVGSEGFSVLKDLGVKTVISVDGTAPDVATAHGFGMRYVHLPFGYDGVPRDQAVRLVKAARTLPGPVFVHCHHGKHRGPTAAAIFGMATEGWDRKQAVAWLKEAGTAPEYRGLFATVDEFTPLSREELDKADAVFPERVKAPALVDMMVRVEETWDHLKAVQVAGFRPPPGHPDVEPAHEALLLAEHFREALRLGESKTRGDGFLRGLEESERRARGLRDALRDFDRKPTPESRVRTEDAFRGVAQRCTTCHARFRDNRRPGGSSPDKGATLPPK
jgi:hypothetical protein